MGRVIGVDEDGLDGMKLWVRKRDRRWTLRVTSMNVVRMVDAVSKRRWTDFNNSCWGEFPIKVDLLWRVLLDLHPSGLI